ncbi:hypothetical protein GGP66_002871 [Salinibacter ruber]|uniref:hypothetical protein n=1 Tax=Salinibacter ruber TaxID=146919 RepID=UPI00216724BB|nr:hypothetical protein [Salinibacter ruber]MCS3675424.1 hypothetical protein [Salinibacter ruber]
MKVDRKADAEGTAGEQDAGIGDRLAEDRAPQSSGREQTEETAGPTPDDTNADLPL